MLPLGAGAERVVDKDGGCGGFLGQQQGAALVDVLCPPGTPDTVSVLCVTCLALPGTEFAALLQEARRFCGLERLHSPPCPAVPAPSSSASASQVVFRFRFHPERSGCLV